MRNFIIFIFLYSNIVFAQTYNSFDDFIDSLYNIAQTNNDSIIDIFWNNLKENVCIPYRQDTNVAFIYKNKDANSVLFIGDFNNWNPNNNTSKAEQIENSGIWIWRTTFPKDARLDYKIIINGNNWILDPDNPYIQYSGFGPNSELRMPDYVFPEETIKRNNINHGTFFKWEKFFSNYLGYNVEYAVYLPYDYQNLTNLPTIYVTDGQEYSNDRLGCMINVLDNLIFDKKIKPLIAIFISPVNPESEQNQRMEQYNLNNNFLKFVKSELIPHIDSLYKTDSSKYSRAVLGTSMGGLNSAFFGVKAYDKFNLIGIQSPAFHYNPQIYSLYDNFKNNEIKIYITTGTIGDTKDAALKMINILNKNAIQYKYLEVNQGHSWGNWKETIKYILEYFFPGKNTKTKKQNNKLLKNHFKIYPNPASNKLNIFSLSDALIELKIYNILGQLKVKTSFKRKILIDIQNFENGIYFLQLSFDKQNISKKIIKLS